MLIVVERCGTFHHYYPIGVYTPLALTVTILPCRRTTWFDLFQEHTYADACLARITDKRHIYRLEMNGISMRDAVK